MKKRFVCFWALLILSCAVFAGVELAGDTATVNRLLKKSLAFQSIDLDSCYLCAQEAYRISESIHYQKGIRNAFIRIGSVLMTKGYNDSSITFIREAYHISKALGDNKGIASTSMLIGYAYSYKGRQDSIFYYLFNALHYSELSNDVNLKIQCYNSIAEFYYQYNDYSSAMVNYTKALALADSAGNRTEELNTRMGIGGIYYKQGRFEEALSYYRKADSLSIETGAEIARAQNLNNIALCYAELKQSGKAFIFYAEALKMYRRHMMQSEEANLYYNMACLYQELNKVDSSIYYLNRSLPIAQSIGEPKRLAECYLLLAKVYAQKGAFDKAYNFHLKYTALSDSLINEEKVRSISEMQTKYETDKKEQQIMLMNEQDKVKNSQRNLLILGFVGLVIFLMEVMRQRNRVNNEKNKSDRLLLNILPAEVAEELKQTGGAIARQYPNVTVMFTDFVNFTGISQQMSPAELVQQIHENFTAFDKIIERNGLEKIKTIGDAYLAVCGLPHEVSDHAQRVINAALDIKAYMEQYGGKFEVRIGINSGPVIAGIVGVKKYAYDIWGDTVNTAARMEQNSEAGKINISGTTYALVRNDFNCEYRGKIKAKNKGEVDMYFV